MPDLFWSMVDGAAPWYVYVRFGNTTAFFGCVVGFLWLQRDATRAVFGGAMRWRFVAFVVLLMAATTGSAEQAFLSTPPGQRIYGATVAAIVSLLALVATYVEVEKPAWWDRWKTRRHG